jgi:formylglycine-generating enzyme required for sulfatase activity
VPGGGFRLPSEAEWEYACRNGSAMPSPLADWSRRAWFRENSLRRKLAPEALVQADSFAPRSVGTREANRWGFHDMQGNVAEWCSSLYRPYLYHATDGRESLDADGLRVVRGGSFADSAELHDPALRHSDRPERRHRWTGLRLARSVPKRER